MRAACGSQRLLRALVPAFGPRACSTELIAAVEKEQMMQVVVDAGRAGGSNVVPTAELLEAVAQLRATGMELTARENTILVSSLGRRGQCDAALRELGNIRACNVFHYNAALDACSKTGRWRDAIAILDEMEKAGTVPDAISFNCVIRACGSAGRAEEAFQLLEMMTWERGIKPNERTFSEVVRACGQGGDVLRAVELLRTFSEDHSVPANAFVLNNMLKALSKAGQVTDACQILRQMQAKFAVAPDAISYNICMAAVARSPGQKKLSEVLQLHDEMILSGVRPNVRTFTTVISACATAGDWKQALSLLQKMEKEGVRANRFTYSAAISAMGKAGRWQHALALLHRMGERRVPANVVAFNAAMAACTSAGHWEEALGVLDILHDPGIDGAARAATHPLPSPDKITYCVGIEACEMGSRSGAVPAGIPLWQRAVQLLATIEQHQDIVDSDHQFYTMVILTCARGGQSIHAAKMLELVESRFAEHTPDVSTCNAVIEACARNGEWEEALEVFVLMQWRGQRATAASYRPLIRVLCAKGEWRKAVELLQEWECPTPGGVSACITACVDARDWGKADALFARAVRTRLLPCPVQREVEWAGAAGGSKAVLLLDVREFPAGAAWLIVRHRLASLRAIPARDALPPDHLAGVLLSTDREETATSLAKELANLQPALIADHVPSDRSKLMVGWAAVRDWAHAAVCV